MRKARLWRYAPIFLLALVVLGLLTGLWLRRRSGSDLPKIPRHPETGVWYQITPKGTVSADGTPWHGDIRLGTENKVIVYFFGGGMAFDNYTAAHSYSVARNDGFYFDTESWILDYMAYTGMGDMGEDNPFRDWTIIAVPYTTGDMHIGSGEWTYTAADGSPATVRFRGYDNYRAMMEASLEYLTGSPEALLIAGTSAGGFGAALLAEDVMGYFPETENVTVLVDSSYLLMDAWPQVAREMWQAPAHIADRLTSDNILLDPLFALHRTYGDRVKILYDCSVRDAELARFQSYIDTGTAIADNAAGAALQAHLRDMVSLIRTNIPSAGLLFWDAIPFSDDPENTLTRHTILVSGYAREPIAGDRSILDWAWDAVEGNVWSYGEELLEP